MMTVATAVIVAAAAAVPTVAIAAIAAPAVRARKPARMREGFDVDEFWRPSAPPLLAPPQDLPLLRLQCAEDRLQGHAAALSLYFGTRQDRAVADHRGFGEKAA